VGAETRQTFERINRHITQLMVLQVATMLAFGALIAVALIR
jgi:hypothetical protein